MNMIRRFNFGRVTKVLSPVGDVTYERNEPELPEGVLGRRDYNDFIVLYVANTTDKAGYEEDPHLPTHIDGKPVTLTWVPRGSRIK